MKKALILCGVAALAATPAVGQRTPAPNAELPGLQAEYRDELVRACGAPAGAVAAALIELSLAGRAELLPGGLVSA